MSSTPPSTPRPADTGAGRARALLARVPRRWLIALGSTVVVAIAVAVGSSVLVPSGVDDGGPDQALQMKAAGLAGAFVRALRKEVEAVDARIDLPAMAAALASAAPDAVAGAVAALEADPRVLKAWLLRPGQRDSDYTTVPPLTFAAIEMVRAAEREGADPPLELHLFGETGAHLAMVRRVVDAGGNGVGYLVVAVDTAVVGRIIAGLDAGGDYAELVQPVSGGRPLTFGRVGAIAGRIGPPLAQARIAGTAWRVSLWPEGSGVVEEPPAATPGILPVPLLAGAAVVVLGGIGFVLARRRRAPETPRPGPRPVAARPTDDAADDSLESKLAALRRGEQPDAPAEEPAGPAYEIHEPEDDADRLRPDVPDLAPSMFRAYDIRGVVGDVLDEEVARAIGVAIGSEAYERGQQTLVVGYDCRVSSPELTSALVEGLVTSGRDVIEIGCVPTPVVYYATHFLNTGSGVMVTGSHNPPEYNGMKIMLAGETLFGDDIAALRERHLAGNLVSGQGSVTHVEVIDEYVRRVSEDVPVALGNAFRIVVDCGNGVAGAVAPKVYRALGHDVVELHCELDGRFPNHHPDPSQPENLAELVLAVREHEADLGFAFDGDGDRLGVVDAAGNIIWPDRQMMLFAVDVLRRNPGAPIIFDVKCSSRLQKVIEAKGGKPVMTRTGHSFIKNTLRELEAPLAGEMSGHIFFSERWYGFDDAIYAGARMLEILMGLKQRPSDVFARLPSGVATPELRLDLPEGRPLELMSRLLSEEHLTDGRVTTVDGLRVDYPDAWGLVRASNTTPSLVLRFEGDDEAALERVQERFRRVLTELDPELDLPF